MNTIIGIDLGTTNSEVAILEDGRPVILQEEGEGIVPSVVGLSPEGELLVGRPARNQYVLYPENTVRSIKRRMGSDERVALGEQVYTPSEISAFILRKLKAMAERHLDAGVDRTVITVPAYFTDAQRQATRDAGEIAGLEVVRIINEPTAAALAYGLDREEDQFLLVYDLGGGTFDVSVIEINSGIVEVRASHGDTQLGGDDFDQRIVDHLVEEFEREHGVDLRTDRKAMARLTRAAEAAKIELSDRPFVRIREEFLASEGRKALNLDAELSRAQFGDLIEKLLDGTLDAISRALDDAQLRPRDIQRVLMVGGSTRIPAVLELVHHRLSLPPHFEINPELCVAMGAAVQAGIIAGEEIDAVLVDVAPHSLGIEVASHQFGVMIKDQFSTIIRRNTSIPTSKSDVYSTVADNQESVRIKVYQGEESVASRNTLLGEFLFEGIPPAPAGTPEIMVQFDYDVDGIVHIAATNRKTGKERSIRVEAASSRLTEAEKQEARARSDRVWGDMKKDSTASAMIERAETILESLEDEEVASTLRDLISDLERVLEEQDTDRIDALQEKLLDQLYELEE